LVQALLSLRAFVKEAKKARRTKSIDHNEKENAMCDVRIMTGVTSEVRIMTGVNSK